MFEEDWWRRKVKVSRSVLSSSLGSQELDHLSCQDPLPMGFSWQEYGVSCHFLLQGSSLPRDWTRVSCTAGRLFTVWVAREAREGVNHAAILERTVESVRRTNEKVWGWNTLACSWNFKEWRGVPVGWRARGEGWLWWGCCVWALGVMDRVTEEPVGS